MIAKKVGDPEKKSLTSFELLDLFTRWWQYFNFPEHTFFSFYSIYWEHLYTFIILMQDLTRLGIAKIIFLNVSMFSRCLRTPSVPVIFWDLLVKVPLSYHQSSFDSPLGNVCSKQHHLLNSNLIYERSHKLGLVSLLM